MHLYAPAPCCAGQLAPLERQLGSPARGTPGSLASASSWHLPVHLPFTAQQLCCAGGSPDHSSRPLDALSWEALLACSVGFVLPFCSPPRAWLPGPSLAPGEQERFRSSRVPFPLMPEWCAGRLTLTGEPLGSGPHSQAPAAPLPVGISGFSILLCPRKTQISLVARLSVVFCQRISDPATHEPQS